MGQNVFRNVALPKIPIFDSDNYKIFSFVNVIKYKLAEKKNNKDLCSICLSPIKKASRPCSCNHYFCRSCIKKWSEKSKQSPCCRRNCNKIIY